MHVHLNVKQVILLGELEDGGRIRVAFFKTNHPHTNTHTHTHTHNLRDATLFWEI